MDIRRKALKLILIIKLALIRWFKRGKIIPLSEIQRYQLPILFDPGLGSSLFVRRSRMVAKGKGLHDPMLRKFFHDTDLGWWSLSVATINYIDSLLSQLKPDCILEFGSGISTVCLSVMLKKYSKTNDPLLISFEQDNDEVAKTRALLKQFGNENMVQIHYAPLRQNKEGIQFYDIDSEKMKTFLAGKRPDFILIDGPSGPEGCRYPAVPLLAGVLSGSSVFVLDDALRDAEIEMGKKWQTIPDVNIKGIVMTEKGLLIGEISR